MGLFKSSCPYKPVILFAPVEQLEFWLYEKEKIAFGAKNQTAIF